MAVPPNIMRANITGALPGGELCVHTLHLRNRGIDNDPLRDTNVGGVAVRLRDLWAAMVLGSTPLAPYLYQGFSYTNVDVYALNEAGKATVQASVPFLATCKGSAASMLPSEVAMAVSFQTPRAGRTGKGRLYLAGVSGTTTNAVGRFDSSVTSAVATSFVNFVQAMNNEDEATGTAIDVGVLSRTATAFTQINTVRVGDVPDVQRRRRASLREVYASVARAS